MYLPILKLLFKQIADCKCPLLLNLTVSILPILNLQGGMFYNVFPAKVLSFAMINHMVDLLRKLCEGYLLWEECLLRGPNLIPLHWEKTIRHMDYQRYVKLRSSYLSENY